MKRGQLKISFGMMFSIILIIIFLTFGFYVITKFLDLQKTIQIGNFREGLQNDIDELWKGGSYDTQTDYLKYNLPTEIKYFCIVDFYGSSRGKNLNLYPGFDKYSEPDKNLYFSPIESVPMRSLQINHLDVEETAKDDNPFCVKNINGIVRFKLKKMEGNPNIILVE